MRPTDPPSGYLENIKNNPTSPLAHKTTTLLQNPDIIIHNFFATRINEMVKTVNFSIQTVLPDSESILDSFLQNEYPQKYKEIQFASLWSSI